MHYELISMKHLQECLDVVIDDLDTLGFWTPRLHEIDVYLSFWPRKSIAGYFDGDIVIPAVNFNRVFGDLGSYGNLRDVLRHEYGHAFAEKYPRLVRRNKAFNEVFGDRYDSDTEYEYDPEAHLTDYAASCPAEDFAECFMAVLKYKGNLERFKHRKELYNKLKWTKSLGRLI